MSSSVNNNIIMNTEENVAKEHEDPSLSSASLTIEFELLGKTFHPVFTHQAFPGEHIRGYHPPLQKILHLPKPNNNSNNLHQNQEKDEEDDKDKTMLPHSSHRHHETASKELSIKVQLAPSCQQCHLEIDMEQKRLPRTKSTRNAANYANKKRKLNHDNHNNNDNNQQQTSSPKDVKNVQPENNQSDDQEDSANDNPKEESDQDEDTCHDNEDEEEDQEDDSEFEDEGNISEVDSEEEQAKEGATRGARMPTKEIHQAMKQGLPTTISHSNSKKKLQDAFLRKPLGIQLEEYESNHKSFVICLADGSHNATAKYHVQVQKMALWFIETADDVDVTQQDGGYWKVLYLFQRHSSRTKQQQYSLAGYVTLFFFRAPFKKPKSGLVVRICQALVLPPYQREGHGKQLLTCLVDIAHGQYDNLLQQHSHSDEDNDENDQEEIVEINVESPAPAFVKLRNRTDLDCFLRSLEKSTTTTVNNNYPKPWIPPSINNQKPVTDPEFFGALSDTQLVQAAATAKIIPRQVQIVMELYKLQQLQEYLHFTTNNSASHKQELEKRFRLMVKKRLNKEHREDLSRFRTKAEKQAFLEQEFQKCLAGYNEILAPKNNNQKKTS